MTPSENTMDEALEAATRPGRPTDLPPQRKLTYGENLVGLNFNPSNDDLVGQLKAKYTEIIDILNDQRNDVRVFDPTGLPSEKGRYISIAITEAQTAQMRAVRAVTAG